MQASVMSFEIKKAGSNERITSIEAGSFKAAIEEFANSYDVNDSDKYMDVSGESKIEFRYVLANSNPQKGMMSESEDNHFDIYRKSKSDKIYAVLSNSESLPEVTKEIAQEDNKIKKFK